MSLIDVVEASAEDRELIERAEAAVVFARRMLEPGTAVIFDVETVSLGGPICEIAMVDAASGVTLVDTLVNPGVPIEAGAYAVHGISDAEVNAPAVPSWPSVWERLLPLVAGRMILAYNADYDREAVTADCRRYGLADSWLTDQRSWADVMVPRSDHLYMNRFLRNDGGHRALGDVHQTRRHLLAMTVPTPWPPDGR